MLISLTYWWGNLGQNGDISCSSQARKQQRQGAAPWDLVSVYALSTTLLCATVLTFSRKLPSLLPGVPASCSWQHHFRCLHPSFLHLASLLASHPSVLAECLLLRGTVDTGKQVRAFVNLVFPWPTKCPCGYKPFFKCALILLFPKWKISNSHNISILTKSTLGLKYHFLYPEGTQRIFTVRGKIKSLIRWIEISSFWEHLVGMSTNVLGNSSSDLEIPSTQFFIIFLRQRFCTFITLFFISFKIYFLWWNWDI